MPTRQHHQFLCSAQDDHVPSGSTATGSSGSSGSRDGLSSLVDAQVVSEEQHPEALAALNDFAAQVQRANQQQADQDAGLAEPSDTQTLADMMARAEGQKDPTERAVSMANIAAATGQLEQAVVLHQEILEQRRRELGDEHLDTQGSMLAVADLLYELEDYAAAAERFREVLALRSARLGADHPETLDVQGELGDLALQQGQYEEAVALHQQTVEGRRRALGPVHLDTLASIASLTGGLFHLERFEEAEAMSQTSMEELLRQRGKQDQNTITAMANHGCIVARNGRPDEGMVLLQDAAEAAASALGADHEVTQRTVNNLAAIMGEHAQQGA